MADDLDLDLDDNNEDIINRKDKRLNKLSSDVKEANEKLAKEAEEKTKLQAERDNLAKESAFYKGFNQVSTKYPGANEYQDKILEKVNAGYDVEDATISILAKEGKYTPPVATVERESPAGGSAATAIPGSGQKTLDEMTRDEKRAALMELEAQGKFKI